MVKLGLELEGSADEVARLLRHLGGGVAVAKGSPAGSPSVPTNHGAPEAIAATAALSEPEATTGTPGTSTELSSGSWTAELAADFTAGLDPLARQVVFHAWRAGDAGIHRSALCRSMEQTPADLRSLLMRMGHTLRRFRRERGMALSRPVVANSPLQSYFVDSDFAAVAETRMFDDRT